MKVNSRDFQRDFARMKAAAAAGETVTVISGGQEFTFQAVKPRTWQGARSATPYCRFKDKPGDSPARMPALPGPPPN